MVTIIKTQKNDPDFCYLVVFLLLIECHEDHREQEIEHHECHKNYTGTNE